MTPSFPNPREPSTDGAAWCEGVAMDSREQVIEAIYDGIGREFPFLPSRKLRELTESIHDEVIAPLREQGRAEAERKGAERGWDEGHEAGQSDQLEARGYVGEPPETPNPYRAESPETATRQHMSDWQNGLVTHLGEDDESPGGSDG